MQAFLEKASDAAASRIARSVSSNIVAKALGSRPSTVAKGNDCLAAFVEVEQAEKVTVRSPCICLQMMAALAYHSQRQQGQQKQLWPPHCVSLIARLHELRTGARNRMHVSGPKLCRTLQAKTAAALSNTHLQDIPLLALHAVLCVLSCRLLLLRATATRCQKWWWEHWMPRCSSCGG